MEYTHTELSTQMNTDYTQHSLSISMNKFDFTFLRNFILNK